MRPHPLLALFTATTAAALASAGTLEPHAAAAVTPAHRHHAAPHVVHLDLQLLTGRAAHHAHGRGLSAVMPLTFAVTGGPALGGYVPPAVQRARLEAARARLARARAAAAHSAAVVAAHAAADAAAHAAANAAARAAAARHHATLVALRRARAAEAVAAAIRRQHVYTPAGGAWAELRQCESGGNYQENSGNGYYGAYQFLPSTWWAIGFSGMPNQAPASVQDAAARVLLQRQGWGAWPACSAALGL